ncbi:hypothetical protein [Streptomyces sp. WM6378]|uniref:hypothetical protein n=1 Tax=Streptomyces sp. WM6378 TaxID=1415557 RepID=UPI0006AFBAB7|nr:hypothetical protein [Streptomyces sp. WM6378]KOU43580.1 hypothetical protein ADK54_17455 [Streptomyces sp. WM6378]
MTQTSYNVRVEYDVPETPPDEIITALYEDLAPYGGSIGSSPAGGLTVRLFLDADSPVDAGTRGIEYVQGALLKQGLDITLMSGFEVLTEAEFDRRLAEPPVPELAGVAEAAEIIQVSRTRVGQLLAEGDLDTYHVQSLASGPIFLAAGLRGYAATEHNRTRGVRLSPLPLTPVERALLEALAATATGTPVPKSTAEHQAVAACIEEMPRNFQVRLHSQPADSSIAPALATLASHKLIRSRGVVRREAEPGHEDDLVITVLDKGHRHAAAPTSDGEPQQAR